MHVHILPEFCQISVPMKNQVIIGFILGSIAALLSKWEIYYIIRFRATRLTNTKKLWFFHLTKKYIA